MKKSLLLIISVFILTGCLKNENISRDFSAGQIGCQPENIQIINEKATMAGMHTWTARCNNRDYFCTYHYGDGASCKEIK